jgi:hypothetical protein
MYEATTPLELTRLFHMAGKWAGLHSSAGRAC